MSYNNSQKVDIVFLVIAGTVGGFITGASAVFIEQGIKTAIYTFIGLLGCLVLIATSFALGVITSRRD